MKLSGMKIRELVEKDELIIDPFEPAQLNPNSYNLRLADTLVVYDTMPAVEDYQLRRACGRGGCGLKPSPVWRTDLDPVRREHAASARVSRRDETKAIQRARMFSSLRGGIGHSIRRPLPLELAKWRDVLDMAKENKTRTLKIPEKGIVLVPGRLYLGATFEYTETHTLVPCIEGRSSVGRLGINIHSTAGFGDVGFCGCWTLELSVVEAVRIYAGVQICQIAYEEFTGPVQPYQSAKGYAGACEPKPCGLWKEFDEKGHPT